MILLSILAVLGGIQYIFAPIRIGIARRHIIANSVCTVGSNFLIVFSFMELIIGIMLLIAYKRGMSAEDRADGRSSVLLIVVVQLICLVMSILL